MPYRQMVNISNFLDTESTNVFLYYAKNTNAWQEYADDFWKGRIFNFSKFEGQLKIVSDYLIQDIKKYIKQKYDAEVYCDTIDIVRWPEGWSQPPHIDGCKGLEYRDYGCIIYLNDDFDGGETYYPNLNIKVKPKSGTIVVHPGDEKHLHGVTEVKNNTRYTIASFWTITKDKASYDSVHKYCGQ